MATPFGETSVPAKYQAVVLAASVKYGVPPAFLAAQINAESGFNPNAVSPAGAIGIAQFMPSTAVSVGIDPHNATDSINAMAKLMAHYKRQFGTWQKALYAYHDGPGAVDNPGPAGIKYAQQVLSVSHVTEQGNGSGDAGTASSVGLSLDPFTNTEKLFSAFTDAKRWKRAGYFMAGFALIVIGVLFLTGKKSLTTALDVAERVGGNGTGKGTGTTGRGNGAVSGNSPVSARRRNPGIERTSSQGPS